MGICLDVKGLSLKSYTQVVDKVVDNLKVAQNGHPRIWPVEGPRRLLGASPVLAPSLPCESRTHGIRAGQRGCVMTAGGCGQLILAY